MLKEPFTIDAEHEVMTASSLGDAINKAVRAVQERKTPAASIYNSRMRMIREYAMVNNHPQLIFSQY